MPRVSYLVVILIGLLVSAVSKAEDEVVAHVPSMLDRYLQMPVDSIDSDAWHSEIDTFEFQDNSPLGRISRVRDLPLLMLSETSHSRFFLGVNRDGIFGLHLRAR